MKYIKLYEKVVYKDEIVTKTELEILNKLPVKLGQYVLYSGNLFFGRRFDEILCQVIAIDISIRVIYKLINIDNSEEEFQFWANIHDISPLSSEEVEIWKDLKKYNL